MTPEMTPENTLHIQLPTDNTNITLPNNQIIQGKDITKVLRAYYKLTKEDQLKEKSAWLNVINQIMPQNHKGDHITDIQILPDDQDNHKVVFVYGK